jgi:hypothetical protein
LQVHLHNNYEEKDERKLLPAARKFAGTRAHVASSTMPDGAGACLDLKILVR